VGTGVAVGVVVGVSEAGGREGATVGVDGLALAVAVGDRGLADGVGLGCLVMAPSVCSCSPSTTDTQSVSPTRTAMAKLPQIGTGLPLTGIRAEVGICSDCVLNSLNPRRPQNAAQWKAYAAQALVR